MSAIRKRYFRLKERFSSLFYDDSKRWITATILICTYGFFKQLKPSQAYLTAYMTGPVKNLTRDEVYTQVYPVTTYANLIFLIPTFLLTDILLYKPVILTESLAYISTWAMLLWAPGLMWMQIMQVTYGLASATDVAYSSYIYCLVSERYYKRVTSIGRTMNLIGSFLGALIGQLLVSAGLSDHYFNLNVISFVNVCIAGLLSMLLPSVTRSIYFKSDKSSTKTQVEPVESTVTNKVIVDEFKLSTVEESINASTGTDLKQSETPDPGVGTNKSIKRRLANAFKLLWLDFRKSYSSWSMIKWSIWWSVATCGFLMVGNYVQVLWQQIKKVEKNDKKALYGAVEGASTLTGALFVFLIQYNKVNWTKWGELLLGTVSLFDFVILTWMAFTSEIWVAYVGYVLFRALYQIVTTIASVEVVRNLSFESYALVFGFNSFIALTLQSIFTAIVVSSLKASVNIQFIVNGGYHGLAGLIFLVFSFYQLYSSKSCTVFRKRATVSIN